MGILDNLLKKAGKSIESSAKQAARSAVNNAANAAASGVQKAAAAASAKSETFTFESLPKTLDELKALPEADLSTPFRTAALTVAALCSYEDNQEATFEMINFLRGPRPMSAYEQQFLRDRLGGKMYVIRSFFAGTSPQNNYTPSEPLSLTFFEDPYTYANEGYAKLNIRSSGADSPRQITLRKKPSTGEWFLWENYLLSDIRIPVAEDEWA